VDVVGETTEDTVDGARCVAARHATVGVVSRNTRRRSPAGPVAAGVWSAHPTTCPRLRGVQVEAHGAAGVHGGVDRRRLELDRRQLG